MNNRRIVVGEPGPSGYYDLQFQIDNDLIRHIANIQRIDGARAALQRMTAIATTIHYMMEASSRAGGLPMQKSAWMEGVERTASSVVDSVLERERSGEDANEKSEEESAEESDCSGDPNNCPVCGGSDPQEDGIAFEGTPDQADVDRLLDLGRRDRDAALREIAGSITTSGLVAELLHREGVVPFPAEVLLSSAVDAIQMLAGSETSKVTLN